MGWLAKRRLRTGPTAALPRKPENLLEIVKLADPDARQDGEDILAADCRIIAPVETEPDLVGGEFETVWAIQVRAEGPLPMDYFDRYLAEGIASRLEGLVVCRGEVIDPQDEPGKWLVLLQTRPPMEAMEELLGESEEKEYGVVAFGEETVLIPVGDPSPMGRTLEPYSDEPVRFETKEEGDAVRIAEAFQGVVVDRWRFRLAGD